MSANQLSQKDIDKIRNDFLELQHGALPLAFYNEPFFTVSLLAASTRNALRTIYKSYFPNSGLNFDSYFATILGNKENPFVLSTIPLVHNGIEIIAQTITWPFYGINVQPLITALIFSPDRKIIGVYEYIVDFSGGATGGPKKPHRILNYVKKENGNTLSVESISKPIFMKGSGEESFNLNPYNDVILPGLFHLLKCNPDGSPLNGYTVSEDDTDYSATVETGSEETEDDSSESIVLFSPEE